MRPTAEKVYGAVTGNAHDPTGNPSARCVVRVAPVPAAEKGVLEHFSRELGVAYDTEGEGEDETPVARIQTFESRLVAELNLVQQIDICRSLRIIRPCPHLARTRIRHGSAECSAFR
jgi:hypothetical protein